jgi:hypothetical protein
VIASAPGVRAVAVATVMVVSAVAAGAATAAASRDRTSRRFMDVPFVRGDEADRHVRTRPSDAIVPSVLA